MATTVLPKGPLRRPMRWPLGDRRTTVRPFSAGRPNWMVLDSTLLRAQMAVLMPETMECSAERVVAPRDVGLGAPHVLPAAVRLSIVGARLEGGVLWAGEAALGRSATVLLLAPSTAGAGGAVLGGRPLPQ